MCAPRRRSQSALKIPKHLSLYLLFGYLAYTATKRGWWPWVLAYYTVFALVSPFGDWGLIARMYWRLLRGPFAGYPWTFNLTSLALLTAKTTLIFPIETALWYIDELVFSGYRKQEVRQPLFLLGQPRSGTTRFEDILIEDKQSLMALTLFEMRYPYLTVQYAIDGLAWLDRTLLGGRLRHVAFDVLHLNKPFGGSGPRHQMRRLQFELGDEDDIIFLFHQMHHFQFCGALPDEEFVRLFYHFDKLPKRVQLRALDFHRRCIQKVLYRRGQGRTYFAKWVAGWNGQLDVARTLYPDAQYIVIVRDPAESLPSWFKLQGLLAKDLTGEDVMDRPHLHRVFKEENIVWFHNQIKFCRDVNSANITVLNSDQFYRDIQGDVRKVRCSWRRVGGPGGEWGWFFFCVCVWVMACVPRLTNVLVLCGRWAHRAAVAVGRYTSTLGARSAQARSLTSTWRGRSTSKRPTARPRPTNPT